MSSAQLDFYDRKMMNLIKQCGWAVQGVIGNEGEPGFVYTVGLAGVPLPEIIMYGLPPKVGQAILNDLAQRMRAGTSIRSGDVLHDVVVGFPVTFLQVTNSRTHLTMANRLFRQGGAAVAALQVVWTDKRGRYPWDAGYDLDPRVQPLLGEKP